MQWSKSARNPVCLPCRCLCTHFCCTFYKLITESKWSDSEHHIPGLLVVNDVSLYLFYKWAFEQTVLFIPTCELSAGTFCTVEIIFENIFEFMSLGALSAGVSLRSVFCVFGEHMCVHVYLIYAFLIRPVLFFHLMALSHLRILIYSQTLWGSLKLSFLFLHFTRRLRFKNKTCLFWFFFSSRFLAGWSRRKSQTTMQNFPVTMAVWFAGWELKQTRTHMHAVQPCILIPPCSLHNRSAF